MRARLPTRLVGLLLGLTVVTGAVDAVSYLALGRVFVANMTGNVVLLGFAAAGAEGFAAWVFVTGIGAFLAGAMAGGRLAAALEADRRRWLTTAFGLEAVLATAALGLSAAGSSLSDGAPRFVAIGTLATAMGLQNATARRLAVPDLTTTVLTLTLTGIGADSRAGSGAGARPWRRWASVTAMLAGAAIGAVLTLDADVTAALALGVAGLAAAGLAFPSRHDRLSA